MKKSFFNRFLLGIAAAVLATGFASAQAKDPTFMKTASSTYPRLASTSVDAPRTAARLPSVKPPVREVAVRTDAAATVEYFQGLQAIVRDLRKNSTGGQTMTPGLKAVWMRKQAAKIDALPTFEVDPELLKAGENISKTLYDASESVTVGMGRSRVRQSAVPAHFDYYRYDDVYAFGPSWGGVSVGNDRGYYSGYGYGLAAYGTSTEVFVPNTYTRTREQLMIGQAERIGAFNVARTALENAEREVAQIRRALSNQYGVDF
jgi:hypothetical protein